MSQEPGGAQRPSGEGLPDFDASGSESLPSFSSENGPATLGEPSERALHRSRTTMLAVIGGAVVVLAVIALVLSQTVFRSTATGPGPTAFPTDERTASGRDEYVPNPEEPEIAPPPPIFTQAPTTECTIPDIKDPAPATAPGTVRGGDLQFTSPDEWGSWYSGSLPYLDEVDAGARRVEDTWYSAVSLGHVVFPEDEGGFPGLETAAVAIFQCYATTSGVVDVFGETPQVTDYRSEAVTVDGQAAWIVQATYHFADPDALETSSASIVTSVVVETPNGPSGLASDVAADHPDHVQDLESIIASLDVVE